MSPIAKTLWMQTYHEGIKSPSQIGIFDDRVEALKWLDVRDDLGFDLH